MLVRLLAPTCKSLDFHTGSLIPLMILWKSKSNMMCATNEKKIFVLSNFLIEEVIYITVNFLTTWDCVQICFSYYLSMYSSYKTIGSKCADREIAIWKVHHTYLEKNKSLLSKSFRFCSGVFYLKILNF